MTDLTDDHFHKQIRENPDDDLAREIYADWLEERGDERSQQLRLLNQAIRAEEDEGVDSIEWLKQAGLPETWHGWDRASLVRASVDMVYEFVYLMGLDDQPGLLKIIRLRWLSLRGQADRREVERSWEDFGILEGRYRQTFMFDSFYVINHALWSDNLYAIKRMFQLERSPGGQMRLTAIALSYLLLGENITPYGRVA